MRVTGQHDEWLSDDCVQLVRRNAARLALWFGFGLGLCSQFGIAGQPQGLQTGRLGICFRPLFLNNLLERLVALFRGRKGESCFASR